MWTLMADKREKKKKKPAEFYFMVIVSLLYKQELYLIKGSNIKTHLCLKQFLFLNVCQM